MTRAKFTITVPEKYSLSPTHERALHNALTAATIASGGRTTIAVHGVWYDSGGKCHSEPGHEHSFLANETNYSPVLDAVYDIVRTLLATGEQAVLLQHWNQRGFGYTMYTKENLP